jgi:hypothetical protein
VIRPTCPFEVVTVMRANNKVKIFHVAAGTKLRKDRARGEEVGRVLCGAPLKCEVELGSYDYDEAHLEVNWACSAYPEQNIDGPHPITAENINEWINYNLERMEKPPEIGIDTV